MELTKSLKTTISPKFSSPLPLPSVHRVWSPPTKTLQTISVSTSVTNHVTTTTKNDNINHPTPQNDDAVAAFWDYQFLFISQRSETAEPVALHVINGAVPADFPAGTYYLAGPGIFSDDHGSTVHPLDGHGYLRAFAFGENNVVKFMARYVKTEAQEEEHQSGTDMWRFTYRGPFSVLRGGRKFGNSKVMKNVANTSVLMWGGRLMCLWEGGDPYEIESGTLKTVGKVDVINGCDSSLEGVSEGGDVWDLAARLLKPILYEFDSNFKLLHKQEFTIPDHLMIHDWAFTDTYYIIFANRIKLDVAGYDWRSGKLDPSIMNVNAGQNDMLPLPHLIQVSITLDTKGNSNEKCEVETLNQWNKSADFPVINPSFSGYKNTCVYAAASSGSRPALPHFPFDTVAKLNVSNKSVRTWSVGHRRFIGEPIFVPKGVEEDDGYLLVVEYAVSVQRCYLVILDPKRIGEADALVARLEVPKHLNFPLGFHGFWASAK
ncbi:hypothetical protein L484_021802 [Morus notabilis]|uniref:Carotenoid cleavage dioxygenase 7 n=1 Tax=Morus notabilis TaxID=981085 RepID=W9R3T3_9ROSA|nr:hypothetical protein L484_021802 [Morus notabilis]